MDVLGQEVEAGDIVIFSAVKSSGFRVAVVSKLGANRVGLIGGYDSRKDNDNLLVITEEQYISMQGRNIVTNEEGMVVTRAWQRHLDGRPGGERVELIQTVEERLLDKTHSIIMLSRTIKGEELGEYAPTQAEIERYKL